MGKEDLILFLCKQGAEQTWRSLRRVLDLSWLIGKQSAIDWDYIINQTRTLKCERMLLIGLFLANELMGTVLPAEVLHRTMAIPAVKAEAEKAKVRILRIRPLKNESFERHIFHLRIRDRLPDRIRFSLKMTPAIGREYIYELFKRLCGPPSGWVRFVPTPTKIVEHMLALARVEQEDIVYDIGCGDGRIITTAARLYGARGLGIDVDPKRISQSKARAREEGVEHLVSFVCQDAGSVDLSPATVVTLYLLPSINEKLRPRLWRQLKPGARIVSRNFDFGYYYPPHKTELMDKGNGDIVPLYLWRK